MRVLITLRRVLVLFLMLLVLPVGLPAAASAQNDDVCTEAEGVIPDIGNYVQGYEVVSGSGGAGSQVVVGTLGDDYLSGGSGHDVLCGYGGADTLEGGSGNDILVGGDGDDNLYGGSGNDTFYASATDWVDEGSGRDTIIPVIEINPNCEVAWENQGSGARLDFIDLSGCVLPVIYLQGAFLDHANLSDANLRGAGLMDASLHKANLSNADLSYANLNDATLSNANLTGAILIGADLRLANFTNANLAGADLSDAQLTNVTWSNTTCPDNSNTDTNGDGTCVGHLNT